MELRYIRKYLDEFDNALVNILFHRMSLVPLVAYTKIRDEIEIYQSERENEIFKRIENFCVDAGMNSKLLTDIYRRIIDEAYVIEGNVLDNGLPAKVDFNSDDTMKEFLEKVKELNSMVKEIGNVKFAALTMNYKDNIENMKK